MLLYLLSNEHGVLPAVRNSTVSDLAEVRRSEREDAVKKRCFILQIEYLGMSAYRWNHFDAHFDAQIVNVGYLTPKPNFYIYFLFGGARLHEHTHNVATDLCGSLATKVALPWTANWSHNQPLGVINHGARQCTNRMFFRFYQI